ncbi:MAG: hypothetical protein J6334_01430 [Kiritimatiellae bacterium]|nr:hypothetical protein [Kiritimatiellia bacterium]
MMDTEKDGNEGNGQEQPEMDNLTKWGLKILFLVLAMVLFFSGVYHIKIAGNMFLGYALASGGVGAFQAFRSVGKK